MGSLQREAPSEVRSGARKWILVATFFTFSGLLAIVSWNVDSSLKPWTWKWQRFLYLAKFKGMATLFFCLAFWIAIDWQNRKWILRRNRNSLNSWIRISKLLRKSTVAIQPRLRLHLNVHWTHIHPKLVQYIGVGEGVVCVGGSHLELHLELHPPTNSPTAQWTWTWAPPWSSSTNSLSSS